MGEGLSQLRQRLSSVSDVDSMDKYRLVPNNLAPYLSQRNLMDYQYGTPFYDNNEGRPDQSGRPREQALAGDGFHYGGQHTMLPFEPIFKRQRPHHGRVRAEEDRLRLRARTVARS